MSSIAVLGRGKTGSRVIELLDKRGQNFTSYHSQNPPTQNLFNHQSVISFLSGDVLSSYYDIILKNPRIIISGSTGVEFDESFKKRVRDSDCVWIQAHNFSLGMNLVRAMIQKLSKAATLYDNYDFHLHETHHTGKKDAPSGTALRMRDWLGEKCVITSDRTGDVIGDHILKLKTAFEEITLRHEALDRNIFAEGALWAWDFATSKKLLPGFYWFEELIQKEL